MDRHSSRPAYGLMGHDKIIAAEYTSYCHYAKSHYYTCKQQTHTAGWCEETPWGENHKKCEG